MTLFRKTRAALPAETSAASARLSAIVERGHAEESVYPNFDDCPKAPSIPRRFWSPHELIDGIEGA